MNSAPLRHKPFYLLWTAQITSNIGDQLYSIALLWYLLSSTQSPAALSMIGMPEMIAGFMFYLWGGMLADRYNPGRMMLQSDIARIAIATTVGVAVMFNLTWFPFFLAMQFLIGIFSTLFYPARAVALRTIVAPEHLSQANAILDTTFRTIRIIAPMSIGILANLMPIGYLFFMNAFCYVFSAVCVFMLRSSLPNKQAVSDTVPAVSPTSQWRETIHELLNKKTLLYILIFCNIGFISWQVIWSVGFPVLASQTGEGDPGRLGILFGFYGVGNLLSSLFMIRFRYHNHLRLITTGWMLCGLGFLVMGMFHDSSMLVNIGAAIAGLSGPLTGIPTITAIQTQSSIGNTGKIFSMNQMIGTIFSLTSSMMGVLFASKLPVTTLFILASGILLVITVMGYVMSSRKIKSVESHESL
ncbi:MFS transporter [Brevibacillus daliensis]|uniref:MFS transporter n=1 Tax=Brevibacillus daliensis TaxID=2892995 RepID=UPI001E510B21|nr:MFS transporter [Brevibacillus daliensis]